MATLDNLKNHRIGVQREVDAFARRRPGLFTNDGRPYFTDAAMQEKNLAAALQPLQQVVASAQEAAANAQTEAKKLASLAHVDPLSRLSTDQLQRYTLLKPLVDATVIDMPFVNLADRLRAVDAYGDEVEKRVYLEAVIRQRTGAERVELRFTIDKLAQGLDETPAALEAVKAAEQATALAAEAAQLAFFAGNELSKADGTEAFDMARRRREYAF